MLDLKFIVEDNNGITVMKCLGRLDSETYMETKDKILKLLAGGMFKLVLDMSETQYVSSAGWGVILGHLKEYRLKGGNIVICRTTGHVKEVYEIMELKEVLESYSTLEKAMASFGNPAG
jgi:anti-anti-sigma factor